MQKRKKCTEQKQVQWWMLITLFVVIIGLGGCADKKEANNNAADVSEQDGTSIYLSATDGGASDDALGIPSIGCDDELVEVKINKKLSPEEALNVLFTYDDYKKEDGLYNVFSLSPNLKIEKMIVANDFAIVTLSEDLVTGDMCDDSHVPAQIRKTLMQFDEIDGVDIFVGDEEVSSYLLKKDDHDNI